MPETNFFWDPVEDNIIQERDETGAITAEYATEPYLYGNLISQNRGGVESQYHFDSQGSTLALSDDNQQVTDTYAYTAFGEATERTGSNVNPFQYIGLKGYYFDAEIGEYNVRRRAYSGVLTRWLTVDPIATLLWAGEWAGRTGYQYSSNSPQNRWDPNGLEDASLREVPGALDARACKIAQIKRRNLLKLLSSDKRVAPDDCKCDPPAADPKTCCDWVYVVIELPLVCDKDLASRLTGGHSGVGFSDRSYYDFGPAEPYPFNTPWVSVPGKRWWDDPKHFGTDPTFEPGLNDIYRYIQTDAFKEFDIIGAKICLPKDRVDAAKSYWSDFYARFPRYAGLFDQCTSTVAKSIKLGGDGISPLQLFEKLRYLKHECGPSRGKPTKFFILRHGTGSGWEFKDRTWR